MQADKKNIDDLFRQKVEENLTDTGSMDNDWQQMKQLLAPAATAFGSKGNLSAFLKANIKLLSFAATVAAISVVAVWFMNNRNSNDNTPKQITENISAANIIVTDTTKKEDTVVLNKPEKSLYRFSPTTWGEDESNDISPIKNFFNKSFSDSTKTENNLTQVDAQKMLNDFYDKIQKPSQEFLIDATKGGEIVGKEGSKIVIPPAAFVDANNVQVTGEVKIILQEYYKYSDMVAANLTTTSNGKQLATGGMVYIKAVQDNKELQLKNSTPVSLTMPTNKFDPQMQLFTSYTEENKVMGNIHSNLDTSFIDFTYNNGNASIPNRQINWNASSNDFIAGKTQWVPFTTKIKVIDLYDNPYRESYGKKRKAFYAIPYECELSTKDVEKILKDKYGNYYDKIHVKRRWKNDRSIWAYSTVKVGDSVEMSLAFALKWKYIDKKDSLTYLKEIIKTNLIAGTDQPPVNLNADIRYRRLQFFIRSGSVDSVFKPLVDSLNIVLKKTNDSVWAEFTKRDTLLRNYRFSINKLGWINCDRFTDYPNKTDYVIEFPKDINTNEFSTNLVFTNFRSIMRGYNNENKTQFANIPVGEPVYLIGLGTKDGKVVSFVEKLTVTKKHATLNNFVNTTPEEFKKKIAMLDVN